MTSPKGDVSRFLDIEAQVQDNDDEGSSDGDTLEDFIEDNDAEDLISPSLKWDQLDSWDGDESPEFMQNLARSIQSRHRTPLFKFHYIVSDASLMADLVLASKQDVYIWRVRVKPGFERDVVVAILQKVIFATPEYEGILSAFSRDAIHGWVYIEAKAFAMIESLLKGINGVIRRRQPPFSIQFVDQSDYPALLNMPAEGYPPHVAIWTWVRIKFGKYRQDLGIVIDVHDMSLECVVALVPRLALSKKRKHSRTPALLFDANAIRQKFGANSVQRHENMYLFKGETFCYGLHFVKFHISRLRSQGVNATEKELSPFRCIPEIWHGAKQSVSPLGINDRVRVIGGSLVGLTGIILDIKELTASFRPDGDEVVPIQDVFISEVRKLFSLGDYVEVVSGVDRGRQGFVVSLDDNAACIFCSRIGLSHTSFLDNPGEEITINLQDLDWKSTPEGLGNVRPVPSSLESNPVVDTAGYTHNANNQSSDVRKMYTGDNYRHMEVRIVKGDSKSHFGVIRGSHFSATGDILYDVQTATRSVNVTATYPGEHLRERHTGLPLDRACWIPMRQLQPISPPPIPLFRVPTPNQIEVVSTPSEAWRPTSDPDEISPMPTVSAPPPGSWLLNPLLLFKKLDVRIIGTTNPPWHGGRHEGHAGFLVVTSQQKDVESSQVVKVGYEQSRMFFKMRHLLPETTTERPGFVSRSAAKPLISEVGERVVIIGPTITGDTTYIGYYALIVHTPFALGVGHACLQIASPGNHWGHYTFFHESSLCRSHVDASGPINWFGTYY